MDKEIFSNGVKLVGWPFEAEKKIRQLEDRFSEYRGHVAGFERRVAMMEGQVLELIRKIGNIKTDLKSKRK